MNLPTKLLLDAGSEYVVFVANVNSAQVDPLFRIMTGGAWVWFNIGNGRYRVPAPWR